MNVIVNCFACGNTGCDRCSGQRAEMIRLSAQQAQQNEIADLVEQFVRENRIMFGSAADAEKIRGLIGNSISFGMRQRVRAETDAGIREELPNRRFDYIEMRELV